MKKLIALLMVCGFGMSFVACGGAQKEEAETEEATEAPAMEPSETETDTTQVDGDTTGVQ